MGPHERYEALANILLVKLRKLHVAIVGERESSETNERNLIDFKTVLGKEDNMPHLKGPDLEEALPGSAERHTRVERVKVIEYVFQHAHHMRNRTL